MDPRERLAELAAGKRLELFAQAFGGAAARAARQRQDVNMHGCPPDNRS